METRRSQYGSEMVVGEGAAPSRLANLAISGAYKTPLHGWCYPPSSEVVLWVRISQGHFTRSIDDRYSFGASIERDIPIAKNISAQ